MKTFNHFVGIFLMNHSVVMVIFGNILFEDVIDDIERIHRFNQMIFLPAVKLAYVCLCRVEHHSLFKLS